MSKRASAFIARKFKRNRDEGRSRKQSLAIAYSQARKEGYKVPRRRKSR